MLHSGFDAYANFLSIFDFIFLAPPRHIHRSHWRFQFTIPNWLHWNAPINSFPLTLRGWEKKNQSFLCVCVMWSTNFTANARHMSSTQTAHCTVRFYCIQWTINKYGIHCAVLSAIRIHANGTHIIPIWMITITSSYDCFHWFDLFFLFLLLFVSLFWFALFLFFFHWYLAKADSAGSTTKTSIQEYLSNIATDPNERNRYVQIVLPHQR